MLLRHFQLRYVLQQIAFISIFFILEIYMLAFFAAACSISCFEQLQLHKCDEQGHIHGYPSRVGVGRSSAGEGR